MKTETIAKIDGAIAGLAFSFVLPRTEWWFAPGALISMWIVLQFGEFITAFICHTRISRRKFAWKRKAVDKIAMWLILLAPGSLDVLTHLVPDIFPAMDFPLLRNDRFLPFSLSALVMFIVGEGYELSINVAKIRGKDSDAWVVVRMFAFVRVINQLRWRLSGREGDAPQRWTDRLDEAKIAALMDHLEKDSSLTPEQLHGLLREMDDAEGADGTDQNRTQSEGRPADSDGSGSSVPPARKRPRNRGPDS